MYSRKRRRQLAALGLAAAMAAPLVAIGGLTATAAEENADATDGAAKDAVADADVSQSLALAQKEASISEVLEALAQADAQAAVEDVAVTAAAQEAPKSNDQLMSEGMADLKAGRYEEAEEKLKQVRTVGMPDRERKRVVDSLTQATDAANQRREARGQFEQGEEALRNNRPVEAIEFYKSAANNRFADPGTKQKAQEQIALAEATRSGDLPAAPAAPAGERPAAPAEVAVEVEAPAAETAAVPDLPAGQHYNEGRKAYKEKNWPLARAHFQAAQAKGYKAGLFQDSPARYLRLMGEREQRMAADTATASAEAKAEADRQAQLDAARRAADARALQATAAADAAAAQPAEAPAEAPAATEVTVETPAAAPGEAPAAEVKVETEAPAEVTVETPAPAEAPAAEVTAEVPAPAPTEVTVETPAAAPAVSASVEGDGTSEADLLATVRMEEVRRQANQYRAQQLVDQARREQAAGRDQEAMRLYSEAIVLDPDNVDALDGRRQVGERTGLRTDGGNLASREEQRIKRIQQETTYRFDSALNTARQRIAAGTPDDFRVARVAIDQARLARASNPTVFPPEQLEAWDARIRETELALAETEGRMAETAEAQANREIADEIARARAEAEAAKEATIADLARTSRRLTAEARYKEALGVIDQILVLDPDNDYAVGVRPLVLDKVQLREQRDLRERLDREIVDVYNRAEEAKIPYDDILRFPTDWPDISAIRDQTVANERGEDREDRAVQAQLERTLPEVTFDGVPFTDVVDFLRDVTSANVFVNWRALETAGIERNAPVTARLRNVKFSKALEIILDGVGGEDVRLGYTIDEGVITISTGDDLSRNTLTRVYDIRDLIIDIPDFTEAPDFSLQSQQTGGGGGGGGGGGQGLFGGSGQGGQEEENEGRTREELIEEITTLIRETVDPDSWRDNGGTVGAIRELQGQLIVTQTPENQRQLVNLLSQLRETRAIQVTVETRFLTVQRNFLEDIGVDIDFVFNLEDDPDRRFDPIAVTNNSINFTQNPNTSVPGSIGAAVQTPLGLTTGFNYLDDFQVTALLRATQAARNATVVTAPRVTLFNGQRAYVLVATQRAYVSDIQSNTGGGDFAVGFDPEISVVESGVVLDVTATVSADRKYVTLTLRPQLSTLVALREFSFQGATGGANLPGTGDDDDDIDPNDINTSFLPNLAVQQPEIQITSVRTSVSVPDGGTLLLGGQTLAGEVELEAGTPVLSKIPFLKRLFTNRSMAKDEQVLLILVKPTIIIQREIEQQQFPLLSSRPNQ